MSSLSTSSPYGMFHNSASHYGPTQAPPMRDGCTTSATFISALSTIKTNGGRTIWKVTGGPDGYSWISGNGQSGYSHPMWKKRMDEAAAKTSAAQMHNFVKDGTLIAVILNDDIEPGSIYPGGIPTGTEIEDEAAYLKSFWSQVPTCVRCRTGYLKTIAPGGSFTSLDFGWSQWKSSRGNVSTWYTNEVNDGRSCKLGVIGGFNLLDGGSGTAPWNQSPNQTGKFGMSPTEINAIGAALSAHTYMIGVIGWSHDANGDGRAVAYYNDPSINGALTNVANAAVGRLRGPLNWQSGNTSASTQTVAGSWALKGVGSPIRNSDAATQSVAMPTFSAGNLLGIVGYSRDSARSFVAPGGWSLAKAISGSSARGGQLVLVYKIADGTEGNQTVTWSGTGGTGMSVMCQSFAFSGNSSGGVLSTVGSSSTWAAASNMGPVKGGFTSAVSDALVLCIAAKGNDFNNGDPVPMDSMSATTSGGETWHRAFITTNGSGDDSGMFLDWAALSGTPSITTKSWTALTSSSGSGAGFLVSFRPAAVVAGQPPSISAIEDVTISVLSTLSFTASSTGSTPITWDLNDDAPSTITLGASTGAFQWTPTTPGEGIYPLVLSATNAFGLDTEAFTITVVSSGTTGSIVSSTTTVSGSTVTVLSGSSGTSFLQNVAPVILNPGDQQIRVGERVSLSVLCADADNDPLVCYLDPNTAPDGTYFDPNSAQFLWTPQMAGAYPIGVICSDGQHTSSSTFTINVVDSRWHRTGRRPTTDFGRTNDSGNAFRRI